MGLFANFYGIAAGDRDRTEARARRADRAGQRRHPDKRWTAGRPGPQNSICINRTSNETDNGRNRRSLDSALLTFSLLDYTYSAQAHKAEQATKHVTDGTEIAGNPAGTVHAMHEVP
ncbi:MAG: Coronin-like protein crn1 [Watsoniomyces obsoletus]|nr:MAG: Coronin-like protein crn1 [Watsoniomyces obsoletus]